MCPVKNVDVDVVIIFNGLKELLIVAVMSTHGSELGVGIKLGAEDLMLSWN